MVIVPEVLFILQVTDKLRVQLASTGNELPGGRGGGVDLLPFL
jgi:hypothetical protein